ncbi:hypothetical protein DL98DRAFT_582867 [Cadophora sp. DSE1049]|nr:hypothetical protein DL98DRAFT_582867 [Cadophora sp. DSE1049]
MADNDTVEFCFKAPPLQSDGSYLLKPKFPSLKKGQKVSASTMAKNRKIPEQYRLSGEITVEELQNMHYENIQSKVKYVVGRSDEEKMLKAAFYDEQALSEDDQPWTYMARPREIATTREGGHDGRSRLETLLAGCWTKIQSASANSDIVEDPSFVAEVVRLSALVVTRILKRTVHSMFLIYSSFKIPGLWP